MCKVQFKGVVEVGKGDIVTYSVRWEDGVADIASERFQGVLKDGDIVSGKGDLYIRDGIAYIAITELKYKV